MLCFQIVLIFKNVFQSFSYSLTWLFKMYPITVLTAPYILVLDPFTTCQSISTWIERTITEITCLQCLMAWQIFAIVVKALRCLILQVPFKEINVLGNELRLHYIVRGSHHIILKLVSQPVSYNQR